MKNVKETSPSLLASILGLATVFLISILIPYTIGMLCLKNVVIVSSNTIITLIYFSFGSTVLTIAVSIFKFIKRLFK